MWHALFDCDCIDLCCVLLVHSGSTEWKRKYEHPSTLTAGVSANLLGLPLGLSTKTLLKLLMLSYTSKTQQKISIKRNSKNRMWHLYCNDPSQQWNSLKFIILLPLCISECWCLMWIIPQVIQIYFSINFIMKHKQAKCCYRNQTDH